MAERTTRIDDEIEIGNPQDIFNRIENHWLGELNISSDDYLYVKKVNKHLIIGQAKIELVE